MGIWEQNTDKKEYFSISIYKRKWRLFYSAGKGYIKDLQQNQYCWLMLSKKIIFQKAVIVLILPLPKRSFNTQWEKVTKERVSKSEGVHLAHCDEK